MDLTTPDGRQELREQMEDTTPGTWHGPTISDVWPPGWIAVAQSDDDGQHVAFSHFITTGHCLEETAREVGALEPSEAKSNAAYIVAVQPNAIKPLLDHVDQLEAANQRLETEAAAMRFVCEWMESGVHITNTEIGNYRACLFCRQPVSEGHLAVCRVGKALDSSAGKSLLAELEKLREQNAKMREALAWYRDEAASIWRSNQEHNEQAVLASMVVLNNDGGARARRALEGTGEK